MIPNSYKLSTRAASVDGSSEDGRCSLLSNRRDGGQRCRTPYGSVLFDGVIPSLHEINSSMCWASQLLTLFGGTLITFDFTRPTNINNTVIPFTGISVIDIVMFNCPSRHVGAIGIAVLDVTNWIPTYVSIANNTSCNHLIRTCIDSFNTFSSVIVLGFISPRSHIYLAEVKFYSNGGHHNCSSVGVMNTATSSTTSTCSSTTMDTTNMTGTEKTFNLDPCILSIICDPVCKNQNHYNLEKTMEIQETISFSENHKDLCSTYILPLN